MPKWYDNRENLRELAAYLIDKDGQIDTVLFLEKPWKWNPEWNEFKEQCYAFQKESLEIGLKV